MHLYLIGLRGSGKSTVGRLVAERLSRAFLDLDELVEQTAGMSIEDMFRARGEAFFRELEAQSLELLAEAVRSGQGAPGVVALGGGTCEREQNRERLRQSGRGVWLQAPLETLGRRLEQDRGKGKRRPALTALPSQEEMRLLAEKRAANYAACADLSLSTEGLTPVEVAEKIVGWWELAAGDDKS